MSMQNLPLETTALLIDDELSAYIQLAHDKKGGTVPAEIQELLDTNMFEEKAKSGDLPGYVEKSLVCDMLDSARYCSAFEGTVTTLLPDQTKDPLEFDLRNAFLVYIPATKAPDLFSAAYESPAHLLQDFLNCIMNAGVELPDGFDLWRRIVEITGTVFC